MNMGHDAALRVGKLIAVFCSGSCALISAGTTRITTIRRVARIRFDINFCPSLRGDEILKSVRFPSFEELLSNLAQFSGTRVPLLAPPPGGVAGRSKNSAQHLLFVRPGWCSDAQSRKEHHPVGVNNEAARHFIEDAALPSSRW